MTDDPNVRLPRRQALRWLAAGGASLHGGLRDVLAQGLAPAAITRDIVRHACWSAAFKDFDPFWEFVGGPLNAGTFGPGAIDRTFGPDVRFVGIPADMKQNRPPSDGFQFFDIGRIDGRTKALTVSLHDGDGRNLYEIELPAIARIRIGHGP